MSSRRMARKADERYDAKEAYNKNLSGKARLHYLENDIHDKGMSMKSPMDMKSPMQNMNHEAMKGKEKHNHMMVHHPAKPPKGKGKSEGFDISKLKDKAAEKKDKSPASMKSPMQRESAKQERKNLMKDNPVDKDASGRRKKLGKAALAGAAVGAMIPGAGAAGIAAKAGKAIGKKLAKKK